MIAAGATYLMKKYTTPKTRLLKRSVPQLVNSSRTSARFIFQPTKNTNSRLPKVMRKSEVRWSQASKTVMPKTCRSFNGPKDNEQSDLIADYEDLREGIYASGFALGGA